MSDRLIVPERDVPPPLPGPPGDDGHGAPRHAVPRRRSRPTPSRSARRTRAASCSGWAGGPSHMDTWNLKPDSEKNGGPFKPIQTSATGVMISEHLPERRQADEAPEHHPLARLEGGQPRPRHLHDAHRLHRPTRPSCIRASARSFAYELGEKLENFDLPHCISINTPGVGAGFLGMAHSPFVVQNPNAPIANLEPPTGVDPMRMGRRLEMLGLVENNFVHQNRGQGSIDHKAVYAKTIRMMNSRYTQAFNLKDEPAAGARRLRPGLVRLGLPDGPAAGRAGRDLRRGLASAAGTRTPTPSTPSRTASCPSSTRAWAPWSPTWPSAACSRTR